MRRHPHLQGDLDWSAILTDTGVVDIVSVPRASPSFTCWVAESFGRITTKEHIAIWALAVVGSRFIYTCVAAVTILLATFIDICQRSLRLQ